MTQTPIAILYEHREWFKPLFAELDRRQVPYKRLHVGDVWYDPAVRECPYSLLVNRVSAYPSASSHPQVVLFVLQYLAYLESIGADVVNGYGAYLVGASKALQLDIFEQLGVPYPRARVIHHPGQAMQAADGLAFPIVFKPNIGGSGAGILKFESPDDLKLAVETRALNLGIDQTALVQEYLTAKGGYIVRVEILAGEYLYAIRLPISEDSFNYCPADGCNVEDPDLAVGPQSPPEAVIQDVKRILSVSKADLGSVEYLISDRDNQVYYYDINPLSNFVADAPNIIGFDPFARLVDFILHRANTHERGRR